MMTTRFAPGVLVLLAVAAVPTVIHSYVDSAVSDGRTARDVPVILAGEQGSATSRRANWDRIGSTDWIERHYGGRSGVKLFVGRSYDAKELYHHPELAVDYGQSYGTAQVTRLPQRPEIPVHALQSRERGARRVALYVLHYGTDYVEDPIRFQLRTSLELLFSRRKPMTLFFAAENVDAERPLESTKAAVILLAAVDAFEKARH